MIYTIGHSTRSFEEFLEILKKFDIRIVIDVRKFPSSKKFPWFNRENLENCLRSEGILYLHYPQLGGYRKEGYENFSRTDEFKHTLKHMLETIDDKTTVILCSELLWFRCHRRYIAQTLTEWGYQVVHIFDKDKVQVHEKSKDVEEKMKLKIFCDKKAKNLTLP